MDAVGNVVYEGNPAPALNLYYLMAREAQVDFNSDNSSGYVHIPSSTEGSGTSVSH